MGGPARTAKDRAELAHSSTCAKELFEREGDYITGLWGPRAEVPDGLSKENQEGGEDRFVTASLRP